MLWDVSHLFDDTCQNLHHFQIDYRSWHAYKLSWPSPNICWVNEHSCCGVFLMSSHTETTWCSTRLKVTVSYCVVIIITRDQKLDSCRKRFGFWKLLVIMPMCVYIYTGTRSQYENMDTKFVVCMMISRPKQRRRSFTYIPLILLFIIMKTFDCW